MIILFIEHSMVVHCSATINKGYWFIAKEIKLRMDVFIVAFHSMQILYQIIYSILLLFNKKKAIILLFMWQYRIKDTYLYPIL